MHGWYRMLGFVLCALAGHAGANAPDVSLHAQATLFRQASALLTDLPDESGIQTDYFGAPGKPELPPATPTARALHLDWEKQAEPLPGGQGGNRSSGSMHIDQSVAYTMQAGTQGPWQLAVQAQTLTSALWATQTPDGQYVNSELGHLLNTVSLGFALTLHEAAAVRLTGAHWVHDSAQVVSRIRLLHGAQALYDATAGEDLGAVEYQGLLAPGSYMLLGLIQESSIHSCCNIAHGGPSGWDLVLELDRVAAVPEPGPPGLWLAGAAGWVAWRRHQARGLAPGARP